MTTPPAPVDRVVITGMGLVTSLGFDAPSTLAAIRSGIANFSEHETVLIECDEHGTRLCGVSIARLPETVLDRRVDGAKRSAALLARAIRECTAGFPKELQQNAIWRLSAGPMQNRQDFIPSLLSSVTAIPIHVLREDPALETSTRRCLFMENIILAVAELRQRRIDACFVGCVDSVCDTPILELLLETDRLKNRMDNPEGIIAGEAAGVFLLELESSANRRGAGILGYIDAWGRGVEPAPWTGEQGNFAALGLRDALKEALESPDANTEPIAYVVADLNGEAPRAREWALAASKAFRGPEKPELIHPADCTGDCGYAMGVVLLAVALDVLSQAPPAARAIIYTSDNGPGRRVLCVHAGNHAELPAEIPKPKKEIAGTAIPAIVNQHWEEASFLWSVRPRLATAANRSLEDLRRHDRRLAANLEGLSYAAAAGWAVSNQWPAFAEASDFFAAAFLAFSTSDKEAIEFLLDQAGTDSDASKGIASALGWLTLAEAKPHIDALFKDDSPHHRLVAVTASALHRHDPGHLLNRAAYDPYPPLQARALRAMGELGRKGTLNLVHLSRSYQVEDDAVRFWASWAGTLAGDPEAMPALDKFLTADSPFRQRAMDAAFRRMAPETALSWWESAARHVSTRRLAISAARIIRDPRLVPWLLELMTRPELARLAGAAVRTISGAELTVMGMEGTAPEGCGADGGDEIPQDPDDDLPWPNMTLLSAWWEKNRKRYVENVPHFLGKPITRPNLLDILRSGLQKDRAAAALDLAMMDPGGPLFDVQAPAGRQSSELYR